MRTISKAMIAMAVAAMMCAVPLFTAEGSDAVIINTGDAGVSFRTDSLTSSEVNDLFTDDEKTSWAKDALALATDQNSTAVNTRWTISDLVISSVTDYRNALGSSLTNDRTKTVRGGGMTCELSFTATVKATYTGYLYDYTDGTQDLYSYLGERVAPSGAVLKVSGTYTTETSDSETIGFFMNAEKKGCIDEDVSEHTQRSTFKGDLTYDSGSSNTKKYSVEAETATVTKENVSFDYGKVSKADIVKNTEVFVKTSYDTYATKTMFNYTTDEGVKGGYDVAVNVKSIISPMSNYTVSTAEDYWIDEDQTLPEFHYYGGSGNTCLFTTAQKDSLKSDDGMRSFLANAGTVSESFSDVESIVDSSTASVDVNTSSDGKFIPILCVVIGVLGIAIVLLVILMVRKKKTA